MLQEDPRLAAMWQKEPGKSNHLKLGANATKSELGLRVARLASDHCRISEGGCVTRVHICSFPTKGAGGSEGLIRSGSGAGIVCFLHVKVCQPVFFFSSFALGPCMLADVRRLCKNRWSLRLAPANRQHASHRHGSAMRTVSRVTHSHRNCSGAQVALRSSVCKASETLIAVGKRFLMLSVPSSETLPQLNLMW